MNFLLKQTKKIIFFNNLFASLKSRRAVFFVFLAVLVLGVSAKISFAATLPAPGASLPSDFQQMINSGTNIPKGYEKYNDQMKAMIASGTMPTSPSEWGAVLKYYGGYNQDQINQAGIQYANQFTPTGHGLVAWLSNLIGGRTGTMSDQDMLNYWKNGQNIPTATDNQKQNASVLLPAASAEQTVTDKAIEGILAPIIGLLFGITYFLKIFVGWSAQLLDFTLNPALYNGFVNSPMVNQGWIVVRDVCNLFFLLVLLFIALCTILKIDKYHAKKTLLTLIIMALLINFSKPIAVFIFDGSQLLMNFFLSQLSNSPGGSGSAMITKATEISNAIYSNIPEYFGNQSNTSAQIFVSYLFAVVFLFIFMVSLLVTALFLLVRIVAIMLLIIVSPFAFFAAIVPDFSKMSSQWWSSLFEYSYYGPAAAFFLLLATQLSGSLPSITQATNGNQTTNFTALTNNIIHYAATIIFLYASIFMAKKFGGAAGGAIVGNANKLMKWAGKGAAMAPYRATAWGARTTGVTGGIQQRIGASRFGKYLTKDGRKNAQEEREAAMAERFGVKGAKDKFTLKKMAEKTKKWKDEGILDDEIELRKQLATGGSIDKMVAARELAKAGKLENGGQYKAGLDALASSPALQNAYMRDAKKKNIHAVIDEEITRTGAAGAAAQAIYNTHLNSVKPAELGDQNLNAFRDAAGNFKPEFVNWANTNLTATHAGIKNDLAKKLNSRDLADFTARGWV